MRHPALALWTGVLGVLAAGPLALLNLYGGVNSFVPRWTAHLARPLGRQRGDLAREATWGAAGGWVGALVAFPVQTYLVFRWVKSGWGPRAAVAAAIVYGASLLPSWKLYVRYWDRFFKHLSDVSAALRFFSRGRVARRLQRQRRRVQRKLRALLAAYQAAAP